MSLYSDNIVCIRVTTKKSTGFRCFSFAQKEKIMEKKQTNKIRLITGTAMLTAVAVGLQYVEIAIPIMPSFIKLDF